MLAAVIATQKETVYCWPGMVSKNCTKQSWLESVSLDLNAA
jgi:hypothetical protein